MLDKRVNRFLIFWLITAGFVLASLFIVTILGMGIEWFEERYSPGLLVGVFIFLIISFFAWILSK